MITTTKRADITSPEDLAIKLANQCIERNELDGAITIILGALEVSPSSDKLNAKRHEIFVAMQKQGVAPEFRLINNYVIHFFPEATEVDATLLCPSTSVHPPDATAHSINYHEWRKLRNIPDYYRDKTPLGENENPSEYGTLPSMDVTRKKDARRMRKEIETFAKESTQKITGLPQKYLVAITITGIDLWFHNIGGDRVFPRGSWENEIKELITRGAIQKFLMNLRLAHGVLDYRSRAINLLDTKSAEIRGRNVGYFTLLGETIQKPSGMDEKLRQYAKNLEGVVLLVFPTYASPNAFDQDKR